MRRPVRESVGPFFVVGYGQSRRDFCLGRSAPGKTNCHRVWRIVYGEIRHDMIAVLHDRLEMGNELIFPFGLQAVRPQLKGKSSGIPNRNPWDVSAKMSEKASPNVIRFGYVNTPNRSMKKVNTRFCRGVETYRKLREREAFRIAPDHQPLLPEFCPGDDRASVRYLGFPSKA